MLHLPKTKPKPKKTTPDVFSMLGDALNASPKQNRLSETSQIIFLLLYHGLLKN